MSRTSNRNLLGTLLFAAGLFHSTIAMAQSPSKPDIYEHFLGSWVGIAHYLDKKNVEVDKPVKIDIQENKKKTSLTWKCTWGTKGEKDYDYNEKKFTLDLRNSEMTTQWSDEDGKSTSHVTGLEEFSKTGLGMFSGEEVVTENGIKISFRVAFKLGPDELYYLWERASAGQPFTPFSVYKLHRLAPTNTVTQ